MPVAWDADPLFALEAVRVRAEGVTILDGVDLALPSAGLTVLLGASGAGKSTLLRLLNRLEVPDEGVVRFRGEDVAGLDPLAHRRRVGMVFQRPVTFGGSGADDLRVAAPAAGDDALEDVARRVGLDTALLDRRADALSGGEAQRLCVARALLTGPEVLLMDEPTSSLDEASRAVVEALGRDLVESGVPVVWVTHDLPQAARIADLVVTLEGGRVRAVEPGGR